MTTEKLFSALTLTNVHPKTVELGVILRSEAAKNLANVSFLQRFFAEPALSD
jgi:hypothetical protein